MRKPLLLLLTLLTLLSLSFLPAPALAQSPPEKAQMMDMPQGESRMMETPCGMMMGSGPCCGCGMGQGMGMMQGMGMGMMEGMGIGMEMGMMSDMRMVWMLDLSEEQRATVRKIHDALRKEHWAIKGKMMDEQVKLRDLQTGEKMDEKKIGAEIDRINALKKEMVMTGVAAMNKVMDVLTKEQKEMLKKGGGMPCGTGAQHRHGMMP